MYIYVYICHILFIISDGSGYFNWLDNLAFMNTTAINMYVWTSLGCVDLEYFGSIHRSAIAVSYSNFFLSLGARNTGSIEPWLIYKREDWNAKTEWDQQQSWHTDKIPVARI